MIRTLIRQSVLNQIHEHGQSTLKNEVCGVLVGSHESKPDGDAVLRIDAAIAGQHTGSSANHVTFTAETWGAIQDEMDAKHPDQRIVGWYHTHPGFGIFLSEMDVFIHRSFFDLPWQVALVYDPVAQQQGLFAYCDDQLVQTQIEVEADAATANTVTAGAGATPASAQADGIAQRLRVLERRQWIIVIMLAICALLALAWPVALQMIQVFQTPVAK